MGDGLSIGGNCPEHHDFPRFPDVAPPQFVPLIPQVIGSRVLAWEVLFWSAENAARPLGVAGLFVIPSDCNPDSPGLLTLPTQLASLFRGVLIDGLEIAFVRETPNS